MRAPATDRFLAIATVVASLLLGGSWSVATRTPVPEWELDLFRAINDLPEWTATTTWPAMQLGSLVGPIVVAGVVSVVWRSRRLTAAVLGAGLLAWFLAKLIKQVVERGRPRYYVAETVVREGDGAGLGFVSGHTAVAFALATAIAPLLPRWGRVMAFAVAALVGTARIIHGVHIPADIVGGAGIGILCGVAVHAIWRLADKPTT